MNEEATKEGAINNINATITIIQGALQLFEKISDKTKTPEERLEFFIKCLKSIKAEFNIEDELKPLTSFLTELKKLADN